MGLRRIVIVGCGSIGRRHARLLARRPDVRVEVCDSDEGASVAAAMESGGSKIHANFRRMLETRPEMVVIATPHALHAEQSIAALQTGSHVLCEKPMSDNLADAQRIADTAAAGQPVLDFGFTLHFHPALLRLKGLIASGELGAVLHVGCRVGTFATLVHSRSRHQADLEGALLLDYAHQPDLLHWMLGVEPQGAYMAAIFGGDLPLRSKPNVLSLTLDFQTPLLATIELNYVQMPQRHEYEIVGDRAWAILDMENNRLRIGRRAEQTETTEVFTVERDRLFEAEHQAFLDAVDGRRGPESPAADALVSMRIVDAALRSWKSAQRMPIPK